MVTISKKHGVNPSIAVCFLCGEDKNEIVLLGRLKGNAEAPCRAVFNQEPCDKCKEYMKQGVILISVKDNDPDQKNPYRTGGWIVVTEDCIKKVFSKPEVLLKKRVGFLEDSAWNAIGFPKTNLQ